MTLVAYQLYLRRWNSRHPWQIPPRRIRGRATSAVPHCRKHGSVITRMSEHVFQSWVDRFIDRP